MMSIPAYGAPEIRYSDRDVREDESLLNLAVAYVDVYGGDFEPLVNAKRELAQTGTLSTRTARVVLNCMRYDVNVSASLPAPKPPSLVESTGRRRPLRRQRINDTPCANTSPHHSHLWNRSEEELADCPGVPWAINRWYYERPARIKRPYVATRAATGLLHRTTGEGAFVWYPNSHDYGFTIPPVLLVRTACKETTRRLKNPILLTKIPEGEMEWRALCTQGCFDA